MQLPAQGGGLLDEEAIFNDIDDQGTWTMTIKRDFVLTMEASIGAKMGRDVDVETGGGDAQAWAKIHGRLGSLLRLSVSSFFLTPPFFFLRSGGKKRTALFLLQVCVGVALWQTCEWQVGSNGGWVRAGLGGRRQTGSDTPPHTAPPPKRRPLTQHLPLPEKGSCKRIELTT